MQKLFVIGGKYDFGRYNRSCMFYDKVTVGLILQQLWKEGKKQHVKFFKDKIVVSG